MSDTSSPVPGGPIIITLCPQQWKHRIVTNRVSSGRLRRRVSIQNPAIKESTVVFYVLFTTKSSGQTGKIFLSFQFSHFNSSGSCSVFEAYLPSTPSTGSTLRPSSVQASSPQASSLRQAQGGQGRPFDYAQDGLERPWMEKWAVGVWGQGGE